MLKGEGSERGCKRGCEEGCERACGCHFVSKVSVRCGKQCDLGWTPSVETVHQTSKPANETDGRSFGIFLGCLGYTNQPESTNFEVNEVIGVLVGDAAIDVATRSGLDRYGVSVGGGWKLSWMRRITPSSVAG